MIKQAMAELPSSLDFFGDSSKPEDSPPDKRASPPERTKATSSSSSESSGLRRRLRLQVEGDDVPSLWTTWDAVPHGGLRRAIEASKWTEPTAVQMQAVPTLYKRRDAVVCAPTGSGKTGAFLIPIAAALLTSEENDDGALIVAPTRELRRQLEFEAQRLLGGLLKVGRDLVVATPRDAKLKTRYSFVILDEADQLFDVQSDMATVDAIFAKKRGTTALFSATLTTKVRELADLALTSGITVTVLRKHINEDLRQEIIFVGEDKHKVSTLRDLVKAGRLKPPCLVFVNNVQTAMRVTRFLSLDGLRAAALDDPRSDRNRIIRDFRSGRIWYLVATNPASRGLDFRALNAVLNFDCPQNPTDYLHRVGRAARAGRPGTALTLFTDDDLPYMRAIANVATHAGADLCGVPDWLLNLPKIKQRRARTGANADDTGSKQLPVVDAEEPPSSSKPSSEPTNLRLRRRPRNGGPTASKLLVDKLRRKKRRRLTQ